MTTLSKEQLECMTNEIVKAGGPVCCITPNDIIYEYNIWCLSRQARFDIETAEGVYTQRKYRNQNWTNKWTPNDN